MGLWSGYFHKDVKWFRIFGYGVAVKSPSSICLFSERMGETFRIRAFGWRFQILAPEKRKNSK